MMKAAEVINSIFKFNQIYYTIGGINNLINAKNYYCYVLSKNP